MKRISHKVIFNFQFSIDQLKINDILQITKEHKKTNKNEMDYVIPTIVQVMKCIISFFFFFNSTLGGEKFKPMTSWLKVYR